MWLRSCVLLKYINNVLFVKCLTTMWTFNSINTSVSKKKCESWDACVVLQKPTKS